MRYKFTTNSRILTEFLPNQKTTFDAFCELINNSIQANAKNIWIEILYTDADEVTPLSVEKITIRDDGIGVCNSELKSKFFDVGTKNKANGKGIGRFSAFQIGKKFTIKTTGKDSGTGVVSGSTFSLSIDQVSKSDKVETLEIDVEDLKEDVEATGYTVIIEELYEISETQKKKNSNKKLTSAFREKHIKDSIFERYPIKIFNKEIKFFVNDVFLQPEDFIIGTPDERREFYTNTQGEKKEVKFTFFQLKEIDTIKIFLMRSDANLIRIVASFEYDYKIPWRSSAIGAWYIYIESEVITVNNDMNINIDTLDKEFIAYKEFIRGILDNFFKEKKIKFDKFSTALKKDEFYPYSKTPATSLSKEWLFENIAYRIEEKHPLLEKREKLRRIIYPLIDKAINTGTLLENVLKEILELDKKSLTTFQSLIEKTHLGDVIEFSEKVAVKKRDLLFIEKITCTDISKHIKERSQLHKYLEKMLWLFGEQYNENTKLLSDTNLENNLKSLREHFLLYEEDKKSDNINELIKDERVKSITDLFLYNERPTDADKREVLIIELKAPKVKISKKEMLQVDNYAFEIENSSQFSEDIKYKIFLIGSNFNANAKFQLDGIERRKLNPFFYFENKKKNIEISVIKWADLLEKTKRRLDYLSNTLQIKDIEIEKMSKEGFNIELNLNSSLKRNNK